MGGGGGGGQMNNSQGRAGGDGGGIVLLKAGTIETSSCSGVSITANGVGPASNGTNDGGGGGGAGGSIVFWVDNWNISGSCPLTISANGGNGSTSNTGSAHGGGGGGAQGVVIFSGPQPNTNVSTFTANGSPGCDLINCSVTAGSPSGANNSGILPNLNTNNPLPIDLLDFSARLVEHGVGEINWITASEVNNDFFRLFRSADGVSWSEVYSCSGQGNSNTVHHYSYRDNSLQTGLNYYRLSQIDFDGTTKVFGPVVIDNTPDDFLFEVFPNPAESFVQINILSNEMVYLRLVGLDGKEIMNYSTPISGSHQIDLFTLPVGVYFIELTEENGQRHFSKIVKN